MLLKLSGTDLRVEICLHSSWVKYLGVGLLGHQVNKCLTFKETTKVIPRVAMAFLYFHQQQRCSFFTSSPIRGVVCLFTSTEVSVRCCLTVVVFPWWWTMLSTFLWLISHSQSLWWTVYKNLQLIFNWFFLSYYGVVRVPCIFWKQSPYQRLYQLLLLWIVLLMLYLGTLSLTQGTRNYSYVFF